MTAHTAFLGLGTNLGDRLEALGRAIAALDATPGVRVTAVSQAYESEPWGVADQPAFANAVAQVSTELGAAALLALCKEIEASMGRLPGVRFGPRPIDIDILLFDDAELRLAMLTIPHPRLLERDFVVTPLLEIAPDVRLPDGTTPDPALAIEGRVTGALGPIPVL